MSGLGRPLTMPELGEVPPGTEPALKSLVENIVQTIEIREGRTLRGKNTRFVTIQDLIDAGVVVEGVIE